MTPCNNASPSQFAEPEYEKQNVATKPHHATVQLCGVKVSSMPVSVPANANESTLGKTA